MIEQDMRSVPLAIQNFTKRLEIEDDEAVRAQMRETIRRVNCVNWKVGSGEFVQVCPK